MWSPDITRDNEKDNLERRGRGFSQTRMKILNQIQAYIFRAYNRGSIRGASIDTGTLLAVREYEWSRGSDRVGLVNVGAGGTVTSAVTDVQGTLLVVCVKKACIKFVR